jgi:high-affinity nickel-transport protein
VSSLRRFARSLGPEDRRQLGAYGVAIGGLHILGWGLIAVYAPGHPVLAGLGVLAYTFGLRHAFDADHISAIDNTTRKLIAQGKRPLGVGFFFSLGHSTVVLALSLSLALGAGALHHALPTLAHWGGMIGTGVSGLFLWAIGLLNLVVLVGIMQLAAGARSGRLDEPELERRLEERGLMNRVCRRRFALIRSSAQMYPVGLLFGLGFDTATEVGLLTITAGVASHATPLAGIAALPILFAAGMSLMDTADGVFMRAAYSWALATPTRKIGYNLVVTGLSVLVALVIGTVELLQLLAHQLGLAGGFWALVDQLSFANMGYAIVAVLGLAWLGATVVRRFGRPRAIRTPA